MVKDHGHAVWPFYAPPGHAVRKVQGVAVLLYAVALALQLTDRTPLAMAFTAVGVLLFAGAGIWAYRHRPQFRRTDDGGDAAPR